MNYGLMEYQYASSYNNGTSRKWVGVITTSSTNQVSFPGLNLYTATQDGEIIMGIMMIPGDYFDEFTKEEPVKTWTYGGIGCVKSPKIVSIGNAQGFGKGGRL